MNDESFRALLLSAAALAAAWWYFCSAEVGQGGEAADSGAADGVLSAVEDLAYSAAGYLIPVDYAMTDPNLSAFLMLIRTGEGTADAGGYSRLFGGGKFDGYADHPRQSVTRSGLTSTAAGAYQILSRTWDDLRAHGYDLPDFTPASQDMAAVALIKRRGALADVLAGRFDVAIRKCNREWASLPGSPYGQPTLTLARAQSILLAYGGQIDPGSVFA